MQGCRHRYNQKWDIVSYCIPVGGKNKNRSTHLRASDLNGQKHVERNLLLFLERSAMTLTHDRTRSLLTEAQLRFSEGTTPRSPIKLTLACTEQGSELLFHSHNEAELWVRLESPAPDTPTPWEAPGLCPASLPCHGFPLGHV